MEPAREESPSVPPPVGSEESNPLRGNSRAQTWRDHLKTVVEIGLGGGVLVALGYLADAARDHFFGIQFPAERGTTHYAIAGGQFLVDVASSLWTHPWISLLAVMLAAVSAAITTGALRKCTETARPRWALVFLLLLLSVIAWKAYRLDIPYVQMRGVLVQPPLKEPEHAKGESRSWLKFRQHDLWTKFLCGHIATEFPDTRTPILERHFPECADLVEKGCSMSAMVGDLVSPPAEHTCLSIEQEFVINVYVSVAVLVLVFGSLRVHSRSQNPLVQSLRYVVFTFALSGGLTLPYVYGKVIRDMSYPSGRTAFDSATFQLTPTIEYAEGLLINTDDKFVTMYRFDNYEFLHLSRNRVRFISVGSSEDIVRIYALKHATTPPN